MSGDTPYEELGEEIKAIGKEVKSLVGEFDSEERLELAHDLRRCYRELFVQGGFSPKLSERIDEYLEDVLMPLLRDHIHATLEETYTQEVSDGRAQEVRNRVIETIRSECEAPIRADVAKEQELIKERIRQDLAREIREELREELRPIVVEEIRQELMSKLFPGSAGAGS